MRTLLVMKEALAILEQIEARSYATSREFETYYPSRNYEVCQMLRREIEEMQKGVAA